jgi:hypothetical protein
MFVRAYRLEFKNCFGAVAAYVNGSSFISYGRFGVALKLPKGVLLDVFNDVGVTQLRYFANGRVKKDHASLPSRILHDQVRLRKLLNTTLKYVP